MEESGSEGLAGVLGHEDYKEYFNVDFVCVSDNFWLGAKTPCLCYGLRGVCYFFLEVDGPLKDLHSGVFGGTVSEPLNDLVWLLDQLVDKDGNIGIDGIYDSVAKVTQEEEDRYRTIDFDVEKYRTEIGVNKLVHGRDKAKTLMARWRFPSLTIHGIQGAFSEKGAKTVIPHKVVGKFSVRIVPNQTPEEVEKKINNFLNKRWKERNSGNKMSLSLFIGARPWITDTNHPNFVAASRATSMVYGVAPDLTREGGSIPVTILLEEATGRNVVLLPMGAGDDGAHAQNEKLNVVNYIQGTKVFAAYMHLLSKL